MSLENFSRQQEQFRDQMTKAFGATPASGLIGGSLMEAAVKQNMAMFENAMKMFPAFSYARAAGEAAAPPVHTETAAINPLDEMRRQMDEMRAQIDRLAAAPRGSDKP